MPELPEAETMARELGAVLPGRRIASVPHVRRDMVHGDPRPLSSLLPGRRIRDVYRRAKRVVLTLTGGVELVFRLGMSGRLELVEPTVPIPRHAHLRLRIAGPDAQELRLIDPRRFGGVWCLTGSRRHKGKRLGPVGVEPLSVTPAVFRRLLDRHRPIKSLLMDQTILAGLGNIYTDESLHAAGLHPLTPAATLTRDEADRLLRAIRSTLRRAIRLAGSTISDYRRITGKPGSFQKVHRVYGRVGLPCRRCGTPIERIVVIGRSTFFCPSCQPEPTP
ncbi:MAG: bifunctional DNA-formamidopyrimidine glycosylase/DNA-(apurinic or apyrimidinic site) lyase, partial [Planctomycetota bacterium]